MSHQNTGENQSGLRSPNDHCEACGQSLMNEQRIEALERLLTDRTVRLSEVEEEVARIALFADLMHGGAYTGGEHAKRPIFRVIRGDRGHPPIIAFNTQEIRRRVMRPFRLGSLRPVLGWSAGVAGVAAATAFLALVIVRADRPTAISSGTYTRHEVLTRRARQESARREARRTARSVAIMVPPAGPDDDPDAVRLRSGIRSWRFVLIVPPLPRRPVGTDGRHTPGSGSSSPTAPSSTAPAATPSPTGTSTPNASTPAPSAS